MFILTEKILRVNQPKSYDYLGAITTGSRGSGKTVYNLKTMVQVFQALYDMTEDEAWEQALDNIIWTMSDLIKLMKSTTYKNRYPVLCYDDAGTSATSLLWSSFIKDFGYLKIALDQIRSTTGCLLINCPSLDSVSKFIRGYDDYLVTIRKHKEWQRIATGYQRYRKPYGRRYIRRLWQDNFSAYCKPKYFHRYMQMREEKKEHIIKLIEQKGTKKQKEVLKNMEEQI